MKENKTITLANLYRHFLQKNDAVKHPPYSRKEDFYRAVLPPELFQKLFPEELKLPSHSRTANGDRSSAIHFTNALKHLTSANMASYRRHIRDAWKQILPKDSVLSEKSIREIFLIDDQLEHDSLLYKRLSNLLANVERYGYDEVLASLTLMASTRFCWDANGYPELVLPGGTGAEDVSALLTDEERAYEDGCKAFQQKDFPTAIRHFECALRLKDSKRNGQTYFHLSEAYQALNVSGISGEQEIVSKISFYLQCAAELKNPDGLLACAKEHCSREEGLLEYDPAKACVLCLELVGLVPKADDRLRGEAYYMLYLCSQSGEFIPPPGDSVRHYLKLSAECGHMAASAAWQELTRFSLICQPETARSDESGLCVLNAQNRRGAWFRTTVPSGWDVIQEDASEMFARFPEPGRPQKYLFIDDDQEKNLIDALKLLQAVKDKRCPPDGWDLTVYIRGESERLAPVVDTALNHMGDTVIPVNILDDDKSAAQRLLSLHPLFYPIRALQDHAETTLHFVVLGSSKCCQWLVREAFWMMSMLSSEKIRTEITVLTPDSDSFIKRLYLLCPGMNPKEGVMGRHKELTAFFPDIKGIDVSLSSVSLMDELGMILENTDSKYYFAIDTGSDMESLNLAIRLREWTIRTSILSGAGSPLTELPVITFKCENPDVAHLSRSMVVQLENQGNSWYNNYCISAFGCFDEQYSWHKIDGGILEKMSYCVHMQYNDILPNSCKQPQYHDAVASAWKSYYTRQYNRDSSFCIASSIPYRLFQSRYSSHGSIVPPHWSILDSSAFVSKENRDYFIKRLNGMPKTDDRVQHEHTGSNGTVYRRTEYGPNSGETKRLAQLEHIRWCAWMLTRGWLPATIQQTLSYMELNDRKRQLYIARLHPCICSDYHLDCLEVALNKDLRKYDYNNIQMTEDFLSLAWFEEEKQ